MFFFFYLFYPFQLGNKYHQYLPSRTLPTDYANPHHLLDLYISTIYWHL